MAPTAPALLPAPPSLRPPRNAFGQDFQLSLGGNECQTPQLHHRRGLNISELWAVREEEEEEEAGEAAIPCAGEEQEQHPQRGIGDGVGPWGLGVGTGCVVPARPSAGKAQGVRGARADPAQTRVHLNEGGGPGAHTAL